MGKVVIQARAESLIQSFTNLKLVKHNRRKERKNNETKGNYGTAKFMSQAVLDERIESKKQKD